MRTDNHNGSQVSEESRYPRFILSEGKDFLLQVTNSCHQASQDTEDGFSADKDWRSRTMILDLRKVAGLLDPVNCFARAHLTRNLAFYDFHGPLVAWRRH